MERDLKYNKVLFIRSRFADPSPPLGTVLGNIGVNTVNFCTMFNNYTSLLPDYFLLRVDIKIFDNRSFSFNVGLPSVGFILSLLRFERIIKVEINRKLKDKLILCIKLYDVLKLIKFKFGIVDYNTISVMKGSIKAMNLVIVRN